ncbi:EF-hand domain-containing protein [Streptomyces sp. NPDC003042]
MTNDLLRRKFEHRFRYLDANGDGYLERDDFKALAGRLIDAAGESVDSPKAKAAHQAGENYWTGIAELAGTASGGRISADQFINALLAARDDERIAGIVRPAVAAHVALADSNDDGVVDISEFKALQCALGVSAQEAEEAFRVLDRNGDGSLSVEEWLAAAMEFYTSTDTTAPGNAVIGRC